VAKKEIELAKERFWEHIRFHFEDPGWGVFEHGSGSVPLDIYVIEPGPSRNYYTLLTHGISNLPAVNPGYATELLICLPPRWQFSEEAMKRTRHAWPVSLLRRLVTSAEGSVALGRIIPNGGNTPYAGNTKLCGVLLYVPVLLAELEDLNVDDRRKIRFLGLIPIYREEMDFAAEHGSDALFERLSSAGVNELLRLDRENICGQKKKRKSRWFGFNPR